jgi:polyisoprenoid-binding protein YceI
MINIKQNLQKEIRGLRLKSALNLIIRKAGIAALTLTALSLMTAANAAPLSINNGRLWLSGDSTLHPYFSTATLMTMSGSADTTSALPDSIKKDNPVKLEVAIPVIGLKSGESGLDKNMYAALKAKDFPQITFKLTGYKVAIDSASQTGETVRAEGLLSIAGTEKPISMIASASASNGGLRLWGQKELLMTDFGVTPPTLLFGTIKVRNPVTIHFDFVLIEKTSTETKPSN